MTAESDLALFVSHASSDANLAKAVVEVLEKATKLSARRIRCTSVAGYQLPTGADTDEQLRREIFGARAFVGLLTPQSMKSTYVLFELGARWGAKLHLAPVLGCGATTNTLSGPLASRNALNLMNRDHVLQLVEDIAGHLKCPLEPLGSFQQAVDLVVTSAAPTTDSAPRVADDEMMNVLQYLARNVKKYPTVQEVAQHLGFSEPKVQYYLDELKRQKMVGMIGGKPYRYHIKHDGRRVLVERGLV